MCAESIQERTGSDADLNRNGFPRRIHDYLNQTLDWWVENALGGIPSLFSPG